MESTRTMVLGVVVLMMALNACGPGPAPEMPGTPSQLPVGVEATAKEALSAQTGVPADEIEVVQAERREWPDACLGLGEEGEACAQVITPGWRITLRAAGEEYVLRTDEDANVIRVED